LKRRRVIIVYHHLIFAQGIKSLLEGSKGLEVTIIDAGKPNILEYIESTKPAVVVIESADRDESALMLNKLLERDPTVLVISLALGDNAMNIYRAQRVEIARAEDLTAAIRSWHPHLREERRHDSAETPRI